MRRLVLQIGAVLAAAALPGAAANSCLPVQGDRIRAGDLAPAVPAFAALDAGLSLGPAPAPGVRRVYGAAELRRLAARHGERGPGAPGPGVSVPELPGEVCLERPLEALSAGRLRTALASAAPELTGALVTIVDFSRQRVPAGEFEFRRSGLLVPPSAGADTVLLWRGRLKYAGGAVAVWVRFRASATRRRVLAAVPLPAGRPLEASRLRVEEAVTSPLTGAALTEIAQAEGRVPRRAIPAGAPIAASMLQAPRDVAAGRRVAVEVRSGQALLKLEAQAESHGRTGELVTVRNLSSGRRFRARVAGPGRVVVDAMEDGNNEGKNVVDGGGDGGGGAAGGAEEAR